MGHFKDNNSFLIHGWMGSKLGLDGTERVIYAIVYSFSQDENTEYFGGYQYLAEAAGVSIDTVKRALISLELKGLIEKKKFENDGKTRNRYSVFLDENAKGTFFEGVQNAGGANCPPEGVQNAGGGGANCPPINNKDNNKENNKEKNTDKSVKKSRRKQNPTEYKSEEERRFYEGMKEYYPYVYKMDVPFLYKDYLELLSKYSDKKIHANLKALNNWKKLAFYREAYTILKQWIETDKKTY